MFLRFSFIAVVRAVAQHFPGALFAADMEGNNQAREQQHGGQLHRQNVRTKQRNTDLFGVNRRTVNSLIVNTEDGVNDNHQQYRREDGGAIMVLFVFVVMMLNLGGSEIEQERQWLKPQVWIGPAILSAIMLVVIVYAILGVNDQGIDGTPISAKAVGITLFGPYVLAVELASMLLLAGLVVAFHVGREERAGEVLSNRKDDSAKRKTEEHA